MNKLNIAERRKKIVHRHNFSIEALDRALRSGTFTKRQYQDNRLFEEIKNNRKLLDLILDWIDSLGCLHSFYELHMGYDKDLEDIAYQIKCKDCGEEMPFKIVSIRSEQDG